MTYCCSRKTPCKPGISNSEISLILDFFFSIFVRGERRGILAFLLKCPDRQTQYVELFWKRKLSFFRVGSRGVQGVFWENEKTPKSRLSKKNDKFRRKKHWRGWKCSSHANAFSKILESPCFDPRYVGGTGDDDFLFFLHRKTGVFLTLMYF